MRRDLELLSVDIRTQLFDVQPIIDEISSAEYPASNSFDAHLIRLQCELKFSSGYPRQTAVSFNIVLTILRCSTFLCNVSFDLQPVRFGRSIFRISENSAGYSVLRKMSYPSAELSLLHIVLKMHSKW